MEWGDASSACCWAASTEMGTPQTSCLSCGEAIVPGALFCRSCGAAVATPPVRNGYRSGRWPWVLVIVLSVALVSVLAAGGIVLVSGGGDEPDDPPVALTGISAPSSLPDSTGVDPDLVIARSTVLIFIDGVRASLSGLDGAEAERVSTADARSEVNAVFAQLGSGASVLGLPECRSRPSLEIECDLATDRGSIVLAVRLSTTTPTGGQVTSVRVR